MAARAQVRDRDHHPPSGRHSRPGLGAPRGFRGAGRAGPRGRVPGIEWSEGRAGRRRPRGVRESAEVASAGGGQAGLATSYHLKQAGVEHVVLESGRVAETWRSRRWDTFCLVTPNWTVQLPGGHYAGAEPDGYMSRGELIDHFERWAGSFKPPVEENAEVTGL